MKIHVTPYHVYPLPENTWTTQCWDPSGIWSPGWWRWGASLSLLGALLGGLLSSVVLRCGRRNSLLAVSLPFSASWMLTVFATSVEMLLATAFLAGLCSAIVIVVSQVSLKILRGALGSNLTF